MLESTLLPEGPIRLTYDEYVELPEDGKIYEIIGGALHVNSVPNTRHQKISRKIQFQMMTQLEDKGLGEVFNAPTDLFLDKENIVQPDLIYISRERIEIIEHKYIKGIHDLVIEILSPGSRRRDILIKSSLYAGFGVPGYWLVDPDIDRIEAFCLEGKAYRPEAVFNGKDTLTYSRLPGFSMDLGVIFG